MFTVQFKFVDETLTDGDKQVLTPKRHSDLASGFDLVSCSCADLFIKPSDRLLVPTGIMLALPHGYEGQVRSRSGLALKNGIAVLNSPGTIDADYRGEIKVILINLSSDMFVVSFGMRIAQLVVAPVSYPSLHEVTKLLDSSRGDLGFGSTGIMSKGTAL